MEKCRTNINLKEVLVFLDDLIVFSSTLEEHETRLIHVLQRLREYGLKLSPDKCRFFQMSVRYLGHIVSREGVETDPEKVESIVATTTKLDRTPVIPRVYQLLPEVCERLLKNNNKNKIVNHQ